MTETRRRAISESLEHIPPEYRQKFSIIKFLSKYNPVDIYWYFIEKYRLNLNPSFIIWCYPNKEHNTDGYFFDWANDARGSVILLERNYLFDVYFVGWENDIISPTNYLIIRPRVWMSQLETTLSQAIFTANSSFLNRLYLSDLNESIEIDLGDALSYPQIFNEVPEQMVKKTLLQLRTSYKRDKTISERPTAYFWAWLSSIITMYLSAKVRPNHGALSLNETLDIIKELMPRLNKIFNDEFVYTGFTYPYASTKALILPKKLCSSFYSTTIGEQWILNKDFERMKECGNIQWDSVGKLWATDDSFRVVRTAAQGQVGKWIDTAIAFIGTVKDKYLFCDECNLLWDKRYLTRTDDKDHVCPICQEEHKKPNVPHVKEKIYNSYHSSSKIGWKYKIQKVGKENSIPIGVELEVECKPFINSSGKEIQFERAWNIYQAQIQANPEWHNLIFERDGSLATNGMEIISNPMTLEYGSKFWKTMLPIIANEAVGWNTDKYVGASYEYGIHLTFSRSFWTDFRLGRLVKFLNAKENSSFLLALAQRSALYGGGAIGSLPESLKQNVGYKCKGKLGTSLNRYSMANVKQNFIELRMFRSTLNVESFLKNIEFVDAFYNWCLQTPYSINFLEFLKWVVSTDYNRNRYINLINYFDRPKFNIKKLKAPIINTWKDLVAQYSKGQKEMFIDTLADADIPEEPN